jgi:MarR family transcriptional regulator, transcriptional regulator for hemolysin
VPDVTENAEPLRDPQPYVERVITTAQRAIRSAYDARYSRLQLNLTEGALLTTLERFGPMTQRELADQLYIGRAAAGQFVDRLEARGLVTRETVAGDRRVWLVTMTDQGKSISGEALSIYFQTAEDLRRGLSTADSDQLIKLALMVQANAEEIAGES